MLGMWCGGTLRGGAYVCYAVGDGVYPPLSLPGSPLLYCYCRAAGCSETQLPRLVPYALRVRQLSLMESIDVRLVKGGEVHWKLTARPIINTVLEALKQADERWSKLLPAQILHPLHKLGIEHLRQILEPGGKRVITTDTLAKHYVGTEAHHRQALARLTAILHTDPKERPPDLVRAPLQPSAGERTLHPAYLALLEADPPADAVPRPTARIPMVPLSRNHVKVEKRPLPPVPEAAAEVLASAKATEAEARAIDERAAAADMEEGSGMSHTRPARKWRRTAARRKLDPERAAIGGKRTEIGETVRYEGDTRLAGRSWQSTAPGATYNSFCTRGSPVAQFPT